VVCGRNFFWPVSRVSGTGVCRIRRVVVVLGVEDRAACKC